ncbi:MAG: response regulator transcription factor [Spirochaetaceae bacterium]|nr:response regulator transcription factor [Spirochaetaceae bacterium]
MRKALIVDDHPVFRNGLKTALGGWRIFDAVDEAGSAAEARDAVDRGGYELAMVDVGLPDGSGMDLVESRAGLAGAPAFFVLTMEADASLARRAVRAGAAGFASKNLALGVLELAVRLVMAGEPYIEGEILRDLLTADAVLSSSRREGRRLVGGLTPRERAALDALLDGLNAKEMAQKLGVSQRTAENYQSAVYAKLGARSPVDLVRIALAAGLIASP